MVSGFTQVVAVIGHPITQVKSPENFNRFFADQQLDSVMIPVDIAPKAVADFLQALRGWHNMSGVLVTVPHKQRAAALESSLSAASGFQVTVPKSWLLVPARVASVLK